MPCMERRQGFRLSSSEAFYLAVCWDSFWFILQVIFLFYREGSYVRVYGQFKTFGNKRTLQAFHLGLVTDFNEVTCHALEVVLTHARLGRSQVGFLINFCQVMDGALYRAPRVVIP